MERLTLDAVIEDPANVPLSLTSPDEDLIVGLVAHAYPMPQVALTLASSVDTDGETVGSTRYTNREIPIVVEVVDPGLPAGTNLVQNPRVNASTDRWTSSTSAGGTLNVFERVPMPDRPEEYGLHYNGTQPADTSTRGYGVTQASGGYFEAAAGTAYTVGFDALVANTAQGATNGWNAAVVWYQADGTTVISTSTGSTVDETAGARQTIRETFTAPALAAYGRLIARQLTNVSGDVVGAYYTRFLVVAATAGPIYFDGDTPGCYWTGTRNSATSVRYAASERLEGAISDVEAKIAKLNRQGGTLRRDLTSGGSITFDVVAATALETTFDKAYDFGIAQVAFTLQATPHGRKSPVTLSRHTETTLPYLAFVETGIETAIDAPVSLEVENNDLSADQGTLLIGSRSKHYDLNASVFIHATDLTPNTSISTLTTGTSGAYGSGSNVIKSVSGVATTTGGEVLAEIEDLPHRGLYRAFVRCRATASDVTLRLMWYAPGGLTHTRWVSIPATTWGLADFGPLTFPTQDGFPLSLLHVSGQSVTATTDVEINWILLMPADDWYAELGGPIPANGSATISRDSVTVESGGTNFSVYRYLGSYPSLRAGGREGGFTQIVAKACVGTRDGYFIEDPATDDIAATVTYTPRYIAVPRPE